MPRLLLVALAAGVTLIAAGCSGSSLSGKTWQWTSIRSGTSSAQVDVPADQQANYTIEFKTDHSFASKVDCNQVGGSYATTGGGAITIVPVPSTAVACPTSSMDSVFLGSLTAAANYKVDAGVLTIMTADESTLAFK